MSGGEICVAHLVRRANDIAAFRDFLDSYQRMPSGIAHDLLVIFKGFSPGDDLAPYDALLEGLAHKRTFVRDVGYDVGPYVRVAREWDYGYFVFLNSFSRFLVPGWLEMLYRQLQRPGIGIVGATGSHQSVSSDYEVFKYERRKTLPAYKRALLPIYRPLHYRLTISGRFAPFPNHHIRSNAFMVARDVIRSLRTERVWRKWDAYRFESSSDGMTQQIMDAGLRPLVVGADGQGYEADDWSAARTFWISRQENLLISDNQTRNYEEGSASTRERLAFHAWRRYPDGRLRDESPPLAHTLFTRATCPQCHASAPLLLQARDVNRGVTDDTFPYYRCGKCRLVFLRPVPTDLGRFYPSDYHAIPRSTSELLENGSDERFKLAAVGGNGTGKRLLEIGPSYGYFAARAKAAGFHVDAIEMDARCCAFLQDVVGIRALHSENVADTLQTVGRFDVIALWHSLEHLRDPWPVLERLPSHLQPGGLLAIASPNPDSLQFRLFGRRWVHLDAPRHVSLMPYRLLERRLAPHGLRLVHVSTRDQGAEDCNFLGWMTLGRRGFPAWTKRRPFTSIGLRFVRLMMKLERRGRLGSAYTVVFQKS